VQREAQRLDRILRPTKSHAEILNLYNWLLTHGLALSEITLLLWLIGWLVESSSAKMHIA
jgi:hypothetical protein